MISNPGPTVKFNDEVKSLTEEAEKLHANGTKIIIVLSHAGYKEDLYFAQRVPHIDVIVGGHSHTFLYDGKVG